MATGPRILVEDERGPRRVALGAELTIGRAAESGLPLHGRDVSRRHARLAYTGGAAFVEDLGSRNGTFVNGERVHGRCRLRAGDVVRVGGARLRYDDAETAEDAPAATPPPLPVRATPPPLPAAALTPATGADERASDGERTMVVDLAPRPRGLRGALAAALRAFRH